VGDDGDHRLRLSPDDSMLGIPVDERIREMCPGAETCGVWLIGAFNVDSMASDGPDPTVLFEIHDVEARKRGDEEQSFIWTL